MSYPRTLAEEGIKILRHHEKAYQIPVRQVQWGGVLNRVDEMGRYIYDETVAMADECCTLAWPKDTRETSGFANAWPAMLEETGGGSSSSPGGGSQGNSAGFTFSGVNTNFSQGSAGINNFGGVRNNFSNGGAGAGINTQLLNSTQGNNPASPGSFGGQAGMNVHIDPDPLGTPPGGAGNGQNGPVATPGTPPKSHCGTMSGKHTMVPILNDGWEPDKRFKGLQVQFPDNFPKMPKGVFGIAIAGTTEYEQKNLFFPTEARLFAVNFAGDPKMGSLVCDLDKDFKIDKKRTAPLQSAFRVLKKPLGNDNAIAIQLGPSGCQDTEGGYVYDVGQPSGAVPAGSGAGSTQTGELPWVIAQLSVNKGGFIDVGSEDDKHNNGADDDKTKINKAHISTKALFRRNKVEDGPLRFEKVYFPGVELDQIVNVHLAWAGRDWAWWTTSPLIPITVPFTVTPVTTGLTEGVPKIAPYQPFGILNPVSTGVATPGNGPLTQPGTLGPQLPGSTPGASSPGPGTTSTPVNEWEGAEAAWPPDEETPSQREARETEEWMRANGIPLGNLISSQQPLVSQFATTALNGFVQGFMTSRSAMAAPLTLSQAVSWGAAGASTGKNNTSSPVSGAMSSFGAQGGQSAAAGSFPALFAGAAGDPWNYTTNPGNSRFPTGTSSGGWIIHPPETTPADQDAYGMVPPRATMSTTYFMTAPGAWFGSGTPQLAIGGITSGWSWGMDTTNGDLLWRSHVNGTPTNGIRFVNATQNIAWYSGTSFTGTIDHVNTANRTYTFVDMSAQVEMFQVGTLNPNGIYSGVIGTLFWDNAGFQLWVNNNNLTGWSQVTGAAGAAGATGATGATGAAGTEVVVTIPGTAGAVAGYGFQPYGTVYTGGAFTPGAGLVAVPGASVTFTLTAAQNITISYALTWSGQTALPSVASGIIIDGLVYQLASEAMNNGSGGDTDFAFGQSGTITLANWPAGSHTAQVCAAQNGAGPIPFSVVSSVAAPTAITVLVPTTLSVIIPPFVIPDNINALLNVGYLTTDRVPLTPFARTLAFDGNVVGADTGPGNSFAFGLNPAGVTISTLTLTNPLATTGGGTGLATIGTALQVLRVNAAGAGLEYATAGGAGTVTASGPPVAAQVAFWTSATDITGDAGFTFDGAKLTITDNMAQQRWAYNGSVFVDLAVNSFGDLSLTTTGGSKGTLSWVSSIIGSAAQVSVNNTDATDPNSNARFYAQATHATASPSLILENGTGSWVVANVGSDGHKFKVTRGANDWLTISTAGVTALNTLNLTNPLTYLYGGTGLATLGTAGQALVVSSDGLSIIWGTVAAAASASTTSGVDSYMTADATSTSPFSRQLKFDSNLFTVVDTGPGGVYYVTGAPVTAPLPFVVVPPSSGPAPVVPDPFFAGPRVPGWVPDPIFSTSQRFLADDGTWVSPSLLIAPGGSLDPLARSLLLDGNLTGIDSGPGGKYFLGFNPNASPSFTGLTLTGKTAGSILYVGADLSISENNASFFWDNANFIFKAGNPSLTLIRNRVAGDGMVNDGDAVVVGDSWIRIPGHSANEFLDLSWYHFGAMIGFRSTRGSGGINALEFHGYRGAGYSAHSTLIATTTYNVYEVRNVADTDALQLIFDNTNGAYITTQTTNSIGIGAAGARYLFIKNQTNLNASEGAGALTLAGNYAALSGTFFIGDGTGWQLNIAKRVASTTTNLFSFLDSGFFGAGTTTPRTTIDSLSTAAAQFRATYTDNTTYTDLITNSSGQLVVTPTGNAVNFVNAGNSVVLAVYGSSSAGRYIQISHSPSNANSFIDNDVANGGNILLGGNATAIFPGADNSVSLGSQNIRWSAFSCNVANLECGANGQNVQFTSVTELTTIAAAATTDTVIQIPLNAVVFAVSVRVTVVIPTAATFTVTGTTSGTQFDVAGGVSTAANTTDVGTRNCPFKNGAAQTIRITPNLVPGANTGRVRVTIHYYTVTAPTS
jgi:hypothetical protein